MKTKRVMIVSVIIMGKKADKTNVMRILDQKKLSTIIILMKLKI